MNWRDRFSEAGHTAKRWFSFLWIDVSGHRSRYVGVSTYLQRGLENEALDLCRELCAKYPDDARGHSLLGHLYLKRRQWGDAAASYETALELEPDRTTDLFRLGLAYVCLEENEKAEKLLRQVIAVDPDKTTAYLWLGYVLKKTQRVDEALQSVKTALSIDPTCARAANELGVIYAECLAQHEKALEWFQKATDINPDYAMGFYNVGGSLHQLGRYLEAVGALQRALQLNSDYAKAHYVVALCYARLDCHESATEHLDRLLSLNVDKGNELWEELAEIDPDHFARNNQV